MQTIAIMAMPGQPELGNIAQASAENGQPA
jgi:hypothetical protein